ncbi:hypothetical protein D3C87_1280440 [compost metagenome]
MDLDGLMSWRGMGAGVAQCRHHMAGEPALRVFRILDQRQRVQLPRGDGGALCQRALQRHGGHEGVFEQRGVVQVGRPLELAHIARDAHVDTPAPQLRRLVLGQQFEWIQVHIRMLFPKALHRCRQDREDGRARKADAEPAQVAGGDGARLLVQPAHLREQVLGARIEKLAGGGQRHRAAGAVEHGRAEQGFQLPKLHADGRGRHEQPVGGFRRAARIHHFAKIA